MCQPCFDLRPWPNSVGEVPNLVKYLWGTKPGTRMNVATQRSRNTGNLCDVVDVSRHQQPNIEEQISNTPPPKQARAIHSQTNLRATQHGMNAEIVTTPTGSRGPQCEIPFQGTWNKHARAKPRQHKCTLTTCAIATVHLAVTASTCPGAHEKHQGM